jgi:hypothetical protein
MRFNLGKSRRLSVHLELIPMAVLAKSDSGPKEIIASEIRTSRARDPRRMSSEKAEGANCHPAFPKPGPGRKRL